jgi:hypothetical protein
MSQFVYTRTEGENTFTDSFNLNKVIRSVEIEDGKRVVVLDDFHERVEQVPEINPKTKAVTMKRLRDTFQSEVRLSKEDSERFIKLFQ